MARASMGRSSAAAVAARFYQIDMRDWLFWLDAAYELGYAAGREHRERFTIETRALTWTALKARMIGAGLHELRDEPLFRTAKTLYLETECEASRGRYTG